MLSSPALDLTGSELKFTVRVQCNGYMDECHNDESVISEVLRVLFHHSDPVVFNHPEQTALRVIQHAVM